MLMGNLDKHQNHVRSCVAKKGNKVGKKIRQRTKRIYSHLKTREKDKNYPLFTVRHNLLTSFSSLKTFFVFICELLPHVKDRKT